MVYVAATKLAIHLTAELALTAGLAVAKKIASKRASHGIGNGSDPAPMSSSTKEMPEEIDMDDTQSSSGVQGSTDDLFPDSDENKIHNYSESIQIDVQIPSHSYSNDHSSYQYHIHINNN